MGLLNGSMAMSSDKASSAERMNQWVSWDG